MTNAKLNFILGAYDVLGRASFLIMSLLMVASLTHAHFASKNFALHEHLITPRILIICFVHILFAAGATWHLVTGSWLTHQYQWTDPNIFNLVVACFESLVIGSVLALMFTRKPFFRVFLVDLFFVQMFTGIVVLGWLLFSIRGMKNLRFM